MERRGPTPPAASAATVKAQRHLETILETWRQSKNYDAWLNAATVDEWEKNGPPETLNLDLRSADFRFADLRGVKLSERFSGGAQKNLETASDLRDARLTGANLQRARLRGVKLQHADLEEADLVEADLCYAHFEHATLERANLSQAALSNVSGLKDAVLRDVNFEGATGLTGTEFERTDLTGARLPLFIRDFAILGPVNDVSSNAQKTFLTMLFVSLYCWLTMGTTSDAALLTNSTSSPLPLIQTPIPVTGFYVTAPLILFAIYIWFQLYLQDMWTGLAGLPAVFPDGKALDEKVNRWLLTGFVRPHFPLLRKSRPPLSRVKISLSIVLAWWLTPLTLIALWLRYLPRHDWSVTAFHVVMVAVTLACAAGLQYLAGRTLRGENGSPMPSRTVWVFGTAAVIAILAILLVSDGAIKGTRPNEHAIDADAGAWPHRLIVPTLLPYVRAHAFADLSEAAVSLRPDNWFLAPRGEPLEAVSGATLAGADLRHAAAQGAFLAKAVLHDANLEWADLRDANLEQSDLRRIKLRGAVLAGANLRGADLTEAKLTQTQLDQACVDNRTRIPTGLTAPRPCPEVTEAAK
jgi:uncharacterized protein YjbI with pentapeptide repeats